MKVRGTQLARLAQGNAIVFAALFALTFFLPNVFEFLERKALDIQLQFRNVLQLNPTYSDAIVHINLDNYSKRSSGQLIWEKSDYARLISKIADGNAKTIANDVMFVSRSDQSGNRELIKAFTVAANVVSPLLLDFSKGFSIEIDKTALLLGENPTTVRGTVPVARDVVAAPMPILVEQSTAVGFVNLVPDSDGMVRRIALVADLGGTLVPSFFLQSVASFLNYDINNIVPVDGSLVVLRKFPLGDTGQARDIAVPLDGSGNLLLNLAGTLDTETYRHSHSAWDLLQAEAPIDFSGKLVFLADTSAQSDQAGDFSPVSIESVFPRSYIVSNAASSLLTENFIRPLGIWAPATVSIVLCLVLMLVCARAGALWLGVAATSAVIISAAGALGLFLFGGWVLPLSPVLFPVVGVYLFSSGWQRRQYQVSSYVDGLTGLHNRRWLDDLLPRQVSRAVATGESLSVGMIDIDHFKTFNDTFGHQAGDFVLAAVAECLMKSLRPTDLSARYGGEEFTVVFPQTTADDAVIAANRLREAVSSLKLVTPNGVDLPSITVSIGVAQLMGNESFVELVESADRALYTAKREGRDRVSAG